jgi:toxin ParE1/3/4
MRVVIREAAYDDLNRIHEWIAKDRPRSASAVIARILESTELLGRFAHIGRQGRAPGTHEWVIPGLPYIIVYPVREDEDLVIVTAIFHRARNR